MLRLRSASLCIVTLSEVEMCLSKHASTTVSMTLNYNKLKKRTTHFRILDSFSGLYLNPETQPYQSASIIPSSIRVFITISVISLLNENSLLKSDT